MIVVVLMCFFVGVCWGIGRSVAVMVVMVVGCVGLDLLGG